MNLPIIFERVCTWNSRRYDRTHVVTLTCSLLDEEYSTEYLESTEEVHRLDALGDTIYVALGGIWKEDVTDEQMNYDLVLASEMVNDLVKANTLPPHYYIPAFRYALEHEVEMPKSTALMCIVNLCLLQMQVEFNFTLEQCYEALVVICDSNDSKSIPSDKVDPSVKANTDKGNFFVAPEPRLQALLDKRYEPRIN